MAAWLNQWAASSPPTPRIACTPRRSSPNPGAAQYVTAALEAGARVFKAHVQVGGYDPDRSAARRRLGSCWRTPARRSSSTAGPGPPPARTPARSRSAAVLTGIRGCAWSSPTWAMPEYGEFLDLCERFRTVASGHHHGLHRRSWRRRCRSRPTITPGCADLGERILFGSDFPNIPYGYPHAMSVLTEIPGVDDDWLRECVLRQRGTAVRATIGRTAPVERRSR